MSDGCPSEALLGLPVPMQDGSISRIESCMGIQYARIVFWPESKSSCRVAAHGAGYDLS